MINLITSILMISALGLSVPQNKVHYDYYDNDNYEYIEIEKPKEKLVSYDDEHNNITLSADELNNYTFTNLASYLNDADNGIENGLINTFLTYNGTNEYGYDEYVQNDGLTYVAGDNSVTFRLDSLASDYAIFVWDYETNIVDFEYSIVIDLDNSSYYDEFKQAIEADISANSSPSYQNILVEVLELLTGGLTTIAAALGSGMAAYVEGLLISGSSMSAFASVIFMFGGIALAFALGRWVVNFIGSLGKRNR